MYEQDENHLLKGSDKDSVSLYDVCLISTETSPRTSPWLHLVALVIIFYNLVFQYRRETQ